MKKLMLLLLTFVMLPTFASDFERNIQDAGDNLGAKLLISDGRAIDDIRFPNNLAAQEDQVISELINAVMPLAADMIGLPVDDTVGRSCSSRDGSKDCFCTGGCWRSDTDCGCN